MRNGGGKKYRTGVDFDLKVDFLKCTYRLELRLDLSSAPGITWLFSLLTDGDSGVHCWQKKKKNNTFVLHKRESRIRVSFNVSLPSECSLGVWAPSEGWWPAWMSSSALALSSALAPDKTWREDKRPTIAVSRWPQLILTFPPAQTLPVLPQLLCLRLQTLNFVSEVLLEEPVGL